MLDTIKQKAKEALGIWEEAFRTLGNTAIPTDAILGPVSFPLASFDERIRLIIDSIIGLSLKDKKAHLLLNMKSLSQMETQLSNLGGEAKELSQLLQQVSDNGGVSDIDHTNFNIACGNGSTISLNKVFTNLSNITDVLSTGLLNLRLLTDVSGVSLQVQKIYELDSIIEQQRNKIKEAVEEIEHLADQSNANFQEIDERRNESNKVQEAIESDLKVIKGKGELIAKIATDSQGSLGTIQNILQSATTLAEQVSAYTANFDSFKTQMTDRLEVFKQAVKNQEAFELKINENSDKVQSLTIKSEELLAGSTKVGLAKSYQDKVTDYKTEVHGSRRWFVGSILFLLVSSLPLAIYALNIELPDGLEFLSGDTITIGGILARILLLFPATWLAAFNSRRYHELFLLREEYSHKATIAQSIHGFKLEAPKYEEEIAAGLFLELNERPSLSKHFSEPSSPPNKILSFLFRQSSTSVP